METPLVLETEHLAGGYARDMLAVEDISVSIPTGCVVAVLGANGSGKSTLLRLIAGLCLRSAGDVRLNGKSIGNVSTAERVRLGLTLVPQGFQLFSGLTVEENLLMGGHTRRRDVAFYRTMEDICSLFPVLRERWRQTAGSLSGGERAMLAVGRGMMTTPKVLLLDEPSLGLAPTIRAKLFDTLRELCVDGRRTVVIAEQDVRNALRVCDYGYVLQHGRLVDEGKAAALTSTALKKAYLGA